MSENSDSLASKVLWSLVAKTAMPGGSSGEWTDELDVLSSYPCSRREAAAIFKTLRLKNYSIQHLDVGLVELTSLTSLDVSFNNIAQVGMLPPNLLGLTINRNSGITRESFQGTVAAPPLRFLSLAYNGLDDVPHDLGKAFPNIEALDLSGNDMCMTNYIGK